MKWFDKWFAKKARWAWENAHKEAERDDGAVPTPYSTGRKHGLIAGNSRSLDSNGVNFTLYSASGGNVVELRHYDSQTDRQTTGLYVIPATEDLGQSLAHIITVEALKR